MPRCARNRHWSDRPQVNLLHHVTNRGVDRRPLFRSALDRLVFLSILAAVCLDSGMRVHAFCLMTNHFHLLVEDPRGLLSHAMLRLQTAYARYLRDSTATRGSGHVFGDRFFSRRINSTRYYRAAVDYILSNPVACEKPLAAAAECYLWSSAAIHVSGISAADGCATLVAAFGGIDRVLEDLPLPGSRYLERMRRHRMESLIAGEWLEADAARQGMAGADLRARLAERSSTDDWEPCEQPEGQDDMVETMEVALVQPEFRGHRRASVIEVLERMAGKALATGDAAAYTLWRFARDGRPRLAKAMRTTVEDIKRAVERVNALRRSHAATHEALSRLEWRMTLALGGAPWRV